MQKSEIYAVIIDTDSYSGNFERSLCAYVTGRIGDCQVGTESAVIACDELNKDTSWFSENIVDQLDDHGVSRPVRIEPTPGFFNDGLGQIYADGTDLKLVKSNYKKRNPGQVYSGIRYPAYRSVIIFFTKKPDQKVRDLIIERAQKFANNPRKCGEKFFHSKFKIVAVRFIKRITTVVDKLI